MIDIPYPQITGRTDSEKIQQLIAYNNLLYQALCRILGNIDSVNLSQNLLAKIGEKSEINTDNFVTRGMLDEYAKISQIPEGGGGGEIEWKTNSIEDAGGHVEWMKGTYTPAPPDGNESYEVEIKGQARASAQPKIKLYDDDTDIFECFNTPRTTIDLDTQCLNFTGPFLSLFGGLYQIRIDSPLIEITSSFWFGGEDKKLVIDFENEEIRWEPADV